MKRLNTTLTLAIISMIFLMAGSTLMSLPNLTLISFDDKVYGGVDDEMAIHGVIKNSNFFDALTAKLKINVTEIQAGQGLLICWGETCYPMVTQTGSINFTDPYVLKAQQESGPNFKTGIEQGGTLGKIKVTFTFYDVNNPSDEVSFTSEAEVTPTGVKFNTEPTFLMAPQPAGDFINIDFTEGIYTEWYISDLTGAKVLSQTLENTDNLNINTSSLNQGVYLLSLISANGAIETRKIIISR